MLDREGHIVHIDFDFLISNSPGGNLLWEKVPFKLTREFVDIMGGEKSKCFRSYRETMIQGFMALQQEYRRIMVLVEMMLSVNRNLPCFVGGPTIIGKLRERLFPKVEGTEEEDHMLNSGEAASFIDQLILCSYGSFRTRAYDCLQYCTQGIY